MFGRRVGGRHVPYHNASGLVAQRHPNRRPPIGESARNGAGVRRTASLLPGSRRCAVPPGRLGLELASLGQSPDCLQVGRPASSRPTACRSGDQQAVARLLAGRATSKRKLSRSGSFTRFPGRRLGTSWRVEAGEWARHRRNRGGSGPSGGAAEGGSSADLGTSKVQSGVPKTTPGAHATLDRSSGSAHSRTRNSLSDAAS
jgi:hypothetical protein